MAEGREGCQEATGNKGCADMESFQGCILVGPESRPFQLGLMFTCREVDVMQVLLEMCKVLKRRKVRSP